MGSAAVDVVTVAAITGGGPTQTITGNLGGQTPKAVIIYATRCVTVGTIIDGGMLSVGMTDGTNQFVNSWVAEDGVANNANYHTNRRFDSAKLVQICDTAGAGVLDGEASFSSFGANTVTISWNDLPSTAVQLVVVFFYGSALSAAVGQITASSTQDLSATVSGLAFAPNALLFATALNAYAAGGTTATDSASIGVAVTQGGTITQSGLGWVNRDGGGTTATVGSTMLRNDACMARLSVTAGGTGSLVASYDVTSFTNDGFVMFTRVGSSPVVAMYLALNTDGQRVWVGNPSLTTSSTGDKAITSPGWKPTALFMCGTAINTINTQADDTQATHVSIGVATASSQASASYEVKDAVANSDTRCLVQSKIVAVPDDVGTIDWSGSITTFDATGFTLNVDDASAADRLVWAFAIEQPFLAIGDTEQISDSPVLKITIQRRVSNDTENISDTPRLLVTIDRRVSNDTEQISDNAILAVTINRRVVAEVEQISDSAIFATTDRKVFGDTEQISDAAIFRVTSDRTTFNDTEQISEAAILVRGNIASFSETEQVIDSIVTLLQASMGATVFGDVEDISDAAVLALRTAFMGFSETEQISDAAVLRLGRVLVVNEIVDILDGFVGGGSGGLHAIKLKRAGRVFQW
jgi:hypothetical protein